MYYICVKRIVYKEFIWNFEKCVELLVKKKFIMYIFRGMKSICIDWIVWIVRVGFLVCVYFFLLYISFFIVFIRLKYIVYLMLFKYINGL